MMMINEQETIEDLNRAYVTIGKEFFNNGSRLVEEKRDKAYMYVYFDIASALTKAADFDKTLQKIEEILKQCRHQDIVKRWVDIEGAKKDALIRRDWGSAFRKVKNGYELSGAIDYGFSKEDISNLAKLHKSGKFRKKIEDLLEDCNFHTECADFSEKKYDEYIIEK